eukprot:g23685.t1
MRRNFFSESELNLWNALLQETAEAKSLRVFKTEIDRFLIGKGIKSYGEKAGERGCIANVASWNASRPTSPPPMQQLPILMPRPLEPALGPLEPALSPFEPALGPLESELGTLESELGTLEPVMGPIEPGLGPIEPGLGPLEPVLGTLES